MAITQQQIQIAEAKQHTAAHDSSPQVRLVAGPGAGKSFAIQERIRWLLQRGVPPDSIYVVSFTRAAALDLRRRVHNYCQVNGQPAGNQVSVSTLHSLALRTLRTAGLLTAYPADPLVMDKWELEKVFDAEFSRASGYVPGHAEAGYTPSRCEEIRREHEAFWGTGQWGPPNYIPPDPPITDTERMAFRNFHGPRTQTYSCVLPGEIVRKCVEHMAAGVLDPAALLGIQHLVVDEFQDLNPSDLEFVDRLIAADVTTFVAGDDDQSIYSFRFASPAGIQSFTTRYPEAGDHELGDCFRCTTHVLEAAKALIAAYPGPNRIPKRLTSLYETANPPEAGVVHRWRIASGIYEARAIAESCSELVRNGVPPREILILISHRPALLRTLTKALEAANVDFEPPRADSFIDTRSGRYIYALLRVVCDTNDYVAHRLILGLRPYVGPGICNSIAESVIASNLNFRDIFYQPLPAGVFAGCQLTALNHARSACAQISSWLPTETLTQRTVDICNIVSQVFDQPKAQEWLTQIAHLPPDMTLEEVRDYLWTDTDEQQASLLEAVYTRLGIAPPAAGLLPQRVRIMTMHGAKGLSARVVFIPGLEEDILPGTKQKLYPGLILEAARMLHVSITRGCAACILSYAEERIIYGKPSDQTHSRFVTSLAGGFLRRNSGLSAAGVQQIVQICGNL